MGLILSRELSGIGWGKECSTVKKQGIPGHTEVEGMGGQRVRASSFVVSVRSRTEREEV